MGARENSTDFDRTQTKDEKREALLPGSVSIWLRMLRDHEAQAADRIWQRYQPIVLRLARHSLRGTKRSICDEEDLAQVVFHEFFRGFDTGRFHDVDNRTDLWKLLFKITSRRAGNVRRYFLRTKRCENYPRRSLPEAISSITDSRSGEMVGLPDDESAIKENLVEMIDDPTLRNVVLWRLDGESVDEIARRLDCVPRTVRRKLLLIREILNREKGDDFGAPNS